ncbi:MAG: hypothetical protein ACI311_02205 [Bacilli bacterium]
MKEYKILVLGVNNIGVSISILLNRLGCSYFVSSLETMKLKLFMEGLVPIVDKELKRIYLQEDVHPLFINKLDDDYEVVFVTEKDFNIFKFLTNHKVKVLIINVYKSNKYLSMLYDTFKKETCIIYWPIFLLDKNNIIGIFNINDSKLLFELLDIYSTYSYQFYNYKIVNEVIEYQNKIERLTLSYIGNLKEKNYSEEQINEFKTIIKNKDSL